MPCAMLRFHALVHAGVHTSPESELDSVFRQLQAVLTRGLSHNDLGGSSKPCCLLSLRRHDSARVRPGRGSA